MTICQVEQGCTHCGTCLVMCPARAITMDRKGAHIDTELCRGCGICMMNCASEAIIRVEKNKK